MHATLQPLFARLESQRHFYTQWIETTPPEKLHHSPGPEKWSAAQVYYHLWFVDNQVVTALENLVKDEKPGQEQRLKTRFRSWVLNLLLRLPIKFKAPPVVASVPLAVPLNQVKQSWEQTRLRLRNVLESFPANTLSREIFRHPRVGMLTLPQTLEFMHSHHAHHHRQLKQLLSV